MKLDRDFNDSSNWAKFDIPLSLAGSLATEQDGNPLEKASHRHEDLSSDAASPISKNNDNTLYQTQEELTNFKIPLKGWRWRVALTKQEDNAIVEYLDHLSQAKVKNLESPVEKPKIFLRSLKATCLVLLILINLCMAYLIGKNYWPVKSPPTFTHKGVVEAQTFVIQGQQGQLQAWISERDGIFLLELQDAQGKAHACISINAVNESTLSLDNKEKKELTKWEEAEAKTNPVENLDKEVAPPPVSESASVSENAAASARYVGSKTSNKYHYPHCKWVRLIKPDCLLTFSSIEEARGHGNHVRCPTCNPPLSDSLVTFEKGW